MGAGWFFATMFANTLAGAASGNTTPPSYANLFGGGYSGIFPLPSRDANTNPQQDGGSGLDSQNAPTENRDTCSGPTCSRTSRPSIRGRR